MKRHMGATAPLDPLAKSNYGHIETTDRVIEADTLVYATPETVQVAEYLDECVEMPEVHVIEDCTVTYYCAEKYTHICGDGDGLTATMTQVTPERTCAVDPSVIPLGSIVSVDYGDGVLHSYVAEDVGAWVTEAHIDICVETHDEALELGRKSATVYWSAANTKPSVSGFVFERTSHGMNEPDSEAERGRNEVREDEATVYWEEPEKGEA